MTQTISRDLDDINAKVKESSYNLRAERVKLIKLKVKEVLGKDVDCAIGEFNTDAIVNLNINDLAKTEGIVRVMNSVRLNVRVRPEGHFDIWLEPLSKSKTI